MPGKLSGRLLLVSLLFLPILVTPQTPQRTFGRADIHRGGHGPYGANNNNLLSYDLDVRVDPENMFLSRKARFDSRC
jgi:hypothetical protein